MFAIAQMALSEERGNFRNLIIPTKVDSSTKENSVNFVSPKVNHLVEESRARPGLAVVDIKISFFPISRSVKGSLKIRMCVLRR